MKLPRYKKPKERPIGEKAQLKEDIKETRFYLDQMNNLITENTKKEKEVEKKKK